MTCTRVAFAFSTMTLVAPAVTVAAPLQRYALVVGANFGGADRPQLQYAVADAERFARVIVELGGVLPEDEIILREPKLRDLTDAFDRLTRRISEARQAATTGRLEVLIYYSGHADEKGLLLGDDRYSYQTLRDRLDRIPADVRIAVLDACASGAFTRLKGGRARPPFLVDASADMRGHAFLTSSAENEAAQESDRIRASYFTHYLVSGFRGAADISGDGKVTLNEAYQFAFNETLRRTVDTKGGAQHPSYDINLSGTGDVVMTDVHQNTATLVLDENLEGRVFIRTASQELVVELYKPAGRKVELALEPAVYDVRVERETGSLAGKADVREGARVSLDVGQFGPAALEPTRRRGDVSGSRFAVAGRNRIETRTGVRLTDGSHSGASVTAGNIDSEVFGGLQFTRYAREDLAITIGIEGFNVEAVASVGPGSVSAGTVDGLALPIGVRWNPLRVSRPPQAFKPFVELAVGPVIGMSKGSFITNGTVSAGSTSRATIGTRIGAGFDVHLARSFSLGVAAGYNWMADFSEPVGVHRNFNGAQVAIGIGWLFGRGNP